MQQSFVRKLKLLYMIDLCKSVEERTRVLYSKDLTESFLSLHFEAVRLREMLTKDYNDQSDTGFLFANSLWQLRKITRRFLSVRCLASTAHSDLKHLRLDWEAKLINV